MKRPKRRLSPDQLRTAEASERWRQAVAQLGAQRWKEAELLCRQVVDDQPGRPEPQHMLALAIYRQGRPDEGIAMLERALDARPDYAPGWKDLGNMLHEAGRLAEAEEANHYLLKLTPLDAAAMHNLALILESQERFDDACDWFQRSLNLQPHNADVWTCLGTLYQRLRRAPQAIDAFREALRRDALHADAHRHLVSALREAGRIEEARDAAHDWCRAAPDNAVARHIAAALGAQLAADRAPPRAADEYIRAVFDQFAATFDQDLSGLGYRAPDWVSEVVVAQASATSVVGDILDAGCGTGLCGARLRGCARRLVGVDLSAGMLAVARRGAWYDELVEAEVTSYLAAHPASFDWIVSADTLNYFGELGPVLTAAANSLKSQGHLVFTLEHDVEPLPAGVVFRLQSTGRYRHHEDRVRRWLSDAGLTIVEIATGTLREEAGRPVAGLRIHAIRPTPATSAES